MGDGGSWRVSSPFRKHYINMVRREDLHCACKRRLRQRMSVHSKEEWPLNLLQFAVIADPLSDRQDVPLIECAVESRSAVTRRTEDDALPGVARIPLPRPIRPPAFPAIYQY